jgi:tetratricopeptide (TPR) repeat protein
MYAYFDETHNAQLEYHAAYNFAVNLKYPKDYLKQLFIKMQDSFLEDRFVSMAIDYYKEGKEMLPNAIETYFFEAELKGNFDETADSLDIMVGEQLNKYWDDQRWLELAAKAYRRSGKLDLAFDIYSRLVELPNSKLNYYLRILDIIKRRKDADGADQFAKDLPFRFQGNYKINEYLHDIYQMTGRLSEATGHAEWLYNRSPSHMPYITKLADLYADQGKLDQSNDLFIRYIGEYPNDPEGHCQLARLKYDNGQSDSVLMLADQALAIDSNYGSALELKGLYHQTNQDMDSALYFYRKTTTSRWPSPYAYHNIAEYFLQTGDSLNRAAGLAMTAIRYFEGDRRGYLLLGKIYYAQGKYKLARLQFFKGSKLHPNDAEYHFRLGKTLLMLGDKAEARKLIEKAIELNLDPRMEGEARQLLAGL